MSLPARPVPIRAAGSHRAPNVEHVADLLDVVFAANETGAATAAVRAARAELSAMRPDALLAGTARWRSRRHVPAEPRPAVGRTAR